jgi:hypothetical protein
MKWLKIPKLYPYFIVLIASAIMFVIILSGQPTDRTFPTLLFIAAKLSLIFGVVELGLAYLGRYETKPEVYQAISRAITTFGMAMCFMLLIAAFEAAN